MKIHCSSIIVILSLLALFGCKKNAPNPYGEGKAQIAIWSKGAFHTGPIEVSIYGRDTTFRDTITQFQPNGTDCEGAYIKRILPAGSYYYETLAQSGSTSSGTTILFEGECTTFPVNYLDIEPRLNVSMGGSPERYGGIELAVQNLSSTCSHYRIAAIWAYYEVRIYKATPDAWEGDYSSVPANSNLCHTSKSFSVVARDGYSSRTEGALKVTFYDPATRRLGAKFSAQLRNRTGDTTKYIHGILENIILP